jgi:glucosylceramidase
MHKALKINQIIMSNLFNALLVFCILTPLIGACSSDDEDDNDYAASFTYEYDSTETNTVNFTNTSEGEYLYIQWDYGDGEGNGDKETDKTSVYSNYYPYAGDYEVSLTVWGWDNSSSDTKMDTQTITIDEDDPDASESIGTEVEFWMTQGNQAVLFEKQEDDLVFGYGSESSSDITIEVDTTTSYQEMDGFGFALTGGSAQVINQMDDQERDALLEELFLTDSNNIGISYIRISIGASDLSAEPFTYDETLDGAEDLDLENFSLTDYDSDLIPVLQSIIELNPDIKILGSPWTAPIWMKSNASYIGGELLSDYDDVYANYLIEYINEMENNGITIDAITIQNEPLNDENNPSMYMSASDQTDFIKNHLGPKFAENNISTKIIIYDHNADNTAYPLSILADDEAAQYVDGSAFHLYAGDISSLSTVHEAYTDKNVYFTEQWTSANGDFGDDLQWHLSNLIIGATRNWSRNVLEWNLASDPNYEPHTTGGCDACQGALTIDGNSVSRNVSYYIIAHASKFVRPGSVRIASNTSDELETVAFKTPDGEKVLIVLNNSTSTSTNFNIQFNNTTISSSLLSGAVGTYVWN